VPSSLQSSSRVSTVTTGRTGTAALRLIALVSLVYDALVGGVILFATSMMASWFGVPPPSPELMADLNGVFLLAVGAGYLLPCRDPWRYRGYLWVMGPLLKGMGASLFVYDYLSRGGPPSFLLFAASDGLLAAVTLWALLRFRARPGAG
jgi:hypothetical protein